MLKLNRNMLITDVHLNFQTDANALFILIIFPARILTNTSLSAWDLSGTRLPFCLMAYYQLFFQYRVNFIKFPLEL